MTSLTDSSFSYQQSTLSAGEAKYIEELLYNGFYAFEAITVRDLDAVVCGICGIAGEVLFGDRNEKNYCSNKQVR